MAWDICLFVFWKRVTVTVSTTVLLFMLDYFLALSSCWATSNNSRKLMVPAEIVTHMTPVLGSYQSCTYDTGYGQGLLQMAQKHFSLVEHLCGFVLCFFRVNEDGSEEESSSILHPQLLHPAAHVTNS